MTLRVGIIGSSPGMPQPLAITNTITSYLEGPYILKTIVIKNAPLGPLSTALL